MVQHSRCVFCNQLHQIKEVLSVVGLSICGGRCIQISVIFKVSDFSTSQMGDVEFPRGAANYGDIT